MAEEDGLVDLYGASYGGFASELYREVRREAWGEEIGQNSWLTRDELARFMRCFPLNVRFAGVDQAMEVVRDLVEL